jgi:6-phosphogluconolactonase (cycloisomerase 2 family)
VINELDSTFTAYGYDESSGALTKIQSISTLPEEFAGTNYCSDVHVHPLGRFVYGSNWGHDRIVICGIAGHDEQADEGHSGSTNLDDRRQDEMHQLEDVDDMLVCITFHIHCLKATQKGSHIERK